MTAWLMAEPGGGVQPTKGWRSWFDDPGVQWGMRLAVVAPFGTFLAGLVVVSVLRLHPEYGLSWAIVHIVAFGAIQWIWLAPVALVSAILGRKRFATGLLIGGVVLAAANAIAWLIGLWIGVA